MRACVRERVCGVCVREREWCVRARACVKRVCVCEREECVRECVCA